MARARDRRSTTWAAEGRRGSRRNGEPAAAVHVVLRRALDAARPARPDVAAGAASPNGSPPPAAPAGGREGGRRRAVVAVVAVVAVGGTAIAASSLGGDGAPEPGRAVATGTATAERRDLVVTDTYEGTLGFGASDGIAAGRAGVVTSVAAVGATVAPGGTLLSIDLRPTVLLAGSVPAFRRLDVEVSKGADVRQLEQGLVDLGQGSGLTVDETFTAATARAVRAWETALGRDDPDGVVELGDVAFAPGPVRIAEVTSPVGTQVKADTVVVEASATTKVVTLELGADAANRLDVGTAVGLELADGTETTGRVATIAEQPADPDAGGGPGTGPVVAVTVSLDDAAAAEGVDSGTVEVRTVRSRTDGATAVPVAALLALAEGGYAVEVVDRAAPGGSRLVAVEPGTYADGWVAVDGEGIPPGTTVVVPR